MLPYFELHSFTVGPVRIAVQPLLASIGILLAHLLFQRRARQWGLDPKTAGWLSFTMVAAGVAGAFLFRWAYLPALLAGDPWLWLKSTRGAASFGGLAGGLAASLIFFRLRRIPRQDAWGYLDALASVFPFGWIFGRIGCSLIHDHPGLRSESWLAVRYPEFPRWDLAVVEVLFFGLVLIPLSVIVSRRRWPGGCLLGGLLGVYGTFRILLDQLHVDPPRYLGVSVDQAAYGSTAMVGLIILYVSIRNAPRLLP